MSRRRTLKSEEDKTDINISPMIDMVFILLIFFIVTTVFVEEQGIDADKPQPGTPQEESTEPIKFRLTQSGTILDIRKGSQSEIPLSAIRSTVAERLRADPKLAVIVETEPDVPAGRMVQVIDEARIGNAEKVSVMQAQ